LGEAGAAQLIGHCEERSDEAIQEASAAIVEADAPGLFRFACNDGARRTGNPARITA
jgi:hypothetical protein